MAYNKVTIDVEARFIDNVTDSAKKADKAVDNLEKKKPKVIIDADASRADSTINKTGKAADNLGKKRPKLIIGAEDRASSKITAINDRIKAFANRIYSSTVKIRDSEALSSLRRISDQAQGIAGKTWTAIVRIKDMALSPLKAIEDKLFSIQTLVTTIFAGMATKKLVLEPISLADQMTNALTGFKTMLGEAAGQAKYDELMELAKATPFGASDVIAKAQSLIGYGFNPDDITDVMTTLGDIAAATGKGNAGLEGLALVLGQIKARPTLSAQDVNQLSGWGVDTRGMLAEYFGVSKAELAEMQEKGKITGDQAVEAILQGSKKRYGGMMASMASSTFSGLADVISDTFKVDVLTRWGQGLQSGGVRTLKRLSDLLDQSQDKIEKLGDLLYGIGESISNWAADRMENAITKMLEIVETDEFKNASLGGKIGILWDGIVVDPIKEWWDNGGSEKASATAEKVGGWLGSALSKGLLAIFGATDALNGENVGTEAGAGIAGSFVQGFVDNFDGSQIVSAFTEAVGNVWDALPWWAKAMLGLKTAGAVGGAIQGAAGGAATLMGGAKTAWSGSGQAGVGLFGALGLKGLIGSSAGSGLLGWLSNTAIGLGAGNLAGGASLGTGALAALGLGSVAGGIGGGAGIISGLLDIYHGKGKTGKEAQDDYFSGGTKIGMVGAGAGIGAGIGSLFGGIGAVPGALIGAGIGGLGSLLGGSKIGKKLSDLWDDVGGLDGIKDSISNFFTDTIPKKWDEFWSGVGDFFTNTVPEAWDTLKEKVKTFFTETLPEKWDEFWSEVGEFFGEKVPEAIGYATGKVYTFFTETLPQKWDEFWGSVETFFTDTLPTWASDVWNNHIVPFFTETLPQKWDEFWDSVETFFTETLPTWASDTWNNHIVPFFTETLPGFIGDLWDGVVNFFTEELPTIGSTIWGAVKTFFTETIPNMISNAWDSVVGFFGGMGDSFMSGFRSGASGSGGGQGGSKGGHARGGIVYPSGSTAPGFAAGGLVGGGGRIVRVAEEGTPEMIIPLGSQRRQRGLKLWQQAGEMMGVPGFANGGLTKDEGIRNSQYGSGNDADYQGYQIDVGGITVEINVGGSDTDNLAEKIRAQANEIADTVAGILADAFSAQFANTPARGAV